MLAAALAASPLSAGCHREARADVRIEWSVAPARPVVGPAVLTLRVLDTGARAVRGARLRVEGHMSHPGMAPAIASAIEREDGAYEAELQLTMPGDWILLITGTLSNGRRVEHRIDLRVADSPA